MQHQTGPSEVTSHGKSFVGRIPSVSISTEALFELQQSNILSQFFSGQAEAHRLNHFVAFHFIYPCWHAEKIPVQA